MQDDITIQGTHGSAVIQTKPNGARTLTIQLHGQEPRSHESACVDLEAAGSTNLEEAARKACESGYLPIFEKLQVSGPKALVVAYHRAADPAFGYATIIKKGVKPLRFAFARINHAAMKTDSVRDALRKVAFETGAIRLLASHAPAAT